MKQKNKAEAAPASGQHTPGPWEARAAWPFPDEAGRRFSAVIKRLERSGYKDEALICSFEHSVFRDNSEANARLIAAAPELLEALRECRPWVRKWSGASGLLAMVDAGIAKAEGRGQ